MVTPTLSTLSGDTGGKSRTTQTSRKELGIHLHWATCRNDLARHARRPGAGCFYNLPGVHYNAPTSA